MARSRVAPVPPVLTVLCLSLCLSSPLLAQRSDRAVIGGVVTDPQGSGVPGATVTITNEETGVETVLVTNSAGAYTTNPLVLGRYSVKVNSSGFKTGTRSGIALRAGDVVRHDVTLQIGEMAEYGHTSGGFIEYTSKSGTNKVHASAYGNLAKDSLNSKGFFNLPKTPLDNKNWGATVGGPIIKNKTFFFINADWTRFRSGTLEGL